MKEKAEENLKKMAITFDLNNDVDKKIITELENYAMDYNRMIELVSTSKSKKDLKINETIALKKYISQKGELKIIDDIVASLDEESFYHYAHQAHCKRTGLEIGKYEFFRNELHKYKDSELKKMVISAIAQ